MLSCVLYSLSELLCSYNDEDIYLFDASHRYVHTCTHSTCIIHVYNTSVDEMWYWLKRIHTCTHSLCTVSFHKYMYTPLPPLNLKFYSLASPFSINMPLSEINPLRVVFCKPVHAVRARGGPPGTNHGPFTAKPSCHHVYVTLWVTPPTSPCPTLSADAEPARKCTEIIFSAHCAV